VRARWPALLLVAALVAHAAIDKYPDKLAEMLWACHVMTLLMAVGVATRRGPLVAAGLIFHVAVGLPSYLIDVVATGFTAPTSVLVHVLPVAVGGLWVRRADLCWWAGPLSWAVFAALLPVSYLCTPRELNVNLAHAPWPPLADRVASPAAVWGSNLVMSVVTIALAAWLLVRVIPERTVHV